MEFSDESYVRLFVRDTKTWLRLGFEGQCVLMFTLRKLDRAGVLDGMEEPAEDLALMTGVPLAIVSVGLARLLERGVFVLMGSVITMPNYVRAQNCRQSDKLRQQESRARRSAESAQGLETERQGFVYVVRAGDGHIKIGFASDVNSRVSNIRRARPDGATLVASWPGSISDESAALQRFSHLRVSGEWFQDDGSIVSWAVTGRDGMSPAVTSGHNSSPIVTPILAQPILTKPTKTQWSDQSREGPETLRLAKALVSSSSDAQSLGSTLAPRESSPESATGIPGVLRKVPADYALPEDIRQDARILGLSDQQIDAYWSELCDGPIGGTRGVLPERLHAYLRKLPAKWKVWADVEKARSSHTIKRSGASGARGGSGVVQERPGSGWAPEQRGRMYAERFKLSIDEMARAYRRSLADGQVLSSTELDEGFLKFMAAEVAKKRKVTR